MAEVTLELEALEGLLPLAIEELTELGFGQARATSATAATFTLRRLDRAAQRRLAEARLAVAQHLLLDFDVPRPRALLGDEHFRRLQSAVALVSELGGQRSFRLSAAGADSPVFQRLVTQLEAASGLEHDPLEGGLLLRVRRAGRGWQVLLRLTDRPLSARSWRVCNLEGGLNATIAAAMNRLLREGSALSGSYVNAMCGSGTLLAEWCAAGGDRASGFDLSAQALECAQANLVAWPQVSLFQADATAVPLADASVTWLASDPPWGDDIGDHASNVQLYPAFLKEAERLLVPGGRLVLLSHELKLLQRLLPGVPSLKPLHTLRVWHGGHRPGIWLLEKQ